MHYTYIDNLKGIAILLVVAVHLNLCFPIEGLWAKICTEGASMPQLFFIISAFLTWKSLDKNPVMNITQYGNFLKKKWVQLSPIYYIAIAISIYFSLIGIKPSKSIIDYLMHLFYINGFIPQYTNDILGVEWYISVLVIFYFISPLIRLYIIDLYSSICLLIGSMLLSGLSTAIIHPINDVFHTYMITTGWISEMPTLSLGIILYYLINNADKSSKSLLSVFIFTVSLIVVSKCLLRYNIQIITGWRVCIYFLLLFLISKYWSNMPQILFFSYLGQHSYGIYCYHIIIISLFRLLSLHIDTSVYSWFTFYSLVLIISLFITLIIERLTKLLTN